MAKRAVKTAGWKDWTFSQLMEELFLLSEVSEIDSVQDDIRKLIKVMWTQYPTESADVKLTKNYA